MRVHSYQLCEGGAFVAPCSNKQKERFIYSYWLVPVLCSPENTPQVRGQYRTNIYRTAAVHAVLLLLSKTAYALARPMSQTPRVLFVRTSKDSCWNPQFARRIFHVLSRAKSSSFTLTHTKIKAAIATNLHIAVTALAADLFFQPRQSRPLLNPTTIAAFLSIWYRTVGDAKRRLSAGSPVSDWRTDHCCCCSSAGSTA